MTLKSQRIKKLGIFTALTLGGLLLSVIVCVPQSQETIEVVGELSKREVAEIRVALRHRTHPSIFPDYSIRSIRGVPARLWERATKADPKIFRIEARTPVFAAVITRLPTNSVGDRYVLWCAFKETNHWWIGDSYHMKNYPNR